MPINTNAYTSSKDLGSWHFRKYHMGLDRGGLNAGTFLTSEAVFIGAGPPRVQDTAGSDIGTVIVPIALTDNVSINQNKMLQQLFEVGARRSYAVSGRSTGSMSISRPMFNGPSLLRVAVGNNKAQGLNDATDQEPGLFPNGGVTGVGKKVDENETEIWINLQSEVFDRPNGYYLYTIDQRERPVSGMYVEDAMIQGHGFNLAAQGITIPEQISMVFDRILPVSVRTPS